MRSFIALPVDAQATQQLSEYVKQLQTEPWANQVNWYPAQNYHLTLQFLGGHVLPKKIEQVKTSMEDWFSEGMTFFEADIQKIQLFPNSKSPHTIVAALDKTFMMQYLLREAEDHLKPLGLQNRNQSFRPHISLGRIKPKTNLENLQIPDSFKTLEDCWLTVDQITLYESQLTDKAPIYKPLKTIRLQRYR